MGCDGGTIPKRKEIVKNKEHRPREERGRGSEAADKWKYCAASRLPLTKPVVAGNCGHLFSKEAIIEFLLDARGNPSKARDLKAEVAPSLDTIRNLKDIKELRLKDNPAWVSHMNGGSSSSSGNAQEASADMGPWQCPITCLETNGKFKFFFPWTCGCLVSERALNEVPNDGRCIVCQKPYAECDLVQVNPQTSEELQRNEAKYQDRKLKPLVSKGDNKSRPTRTTTKTTTTVTNTNRSRSNSPGIT